jgi:copper chaperone CopZ
MNKYVLIALLAVAGSAAAWVALRAKDPTYKAPVLADPSTIPFLLSSTPGEGELVRVFEVDGMCCGGCRPKVHAAALAVAGVREAAVDQEAGTATLLVRSDVATSTLEQALTFDKYEAHARP